MSAMNFLIFFVLIAGIACREYANPDQDVDSEEDSVTDSIVDRIVAYKKCRYGIAGKCSKIWWWTKCPRGSTCWRGYCCRHKPNLKCKHGSKGSCYINNRKCPVGYTCRLAKYGGRGTCCKIRPDPECEFGAPGGTCYNHEWSLVKRKCKPGYTCKTLPGSKRGICCIERACKHGQKGICGSILGSTCSADTTCMFKPSYPDASGLCCLNKKPIGRCPKPSGLLGTCRFNPSKNCLSHDKCKPGYMCCKEGCGKVCKMAIQEEIDAGEP